VVAELVDDEEWLVVEVWLVAGEIMLLTQDE
jgi:hypothetical protein